MNRSILIVICDFLLVSLLAFSTVDINKVSDEGTPRNMKVDISTTQPDAGKDVVAVMRQALDEERKNRDQLMGELNRARTTASEREKQISSVKQELQTREQQAQGLQQEQSTLSQRFAAAQTNLQALSQQLQSSTAEALLSKEKLDAMQAELRKQADQSTALQNQMNVLSKSNQMVLAERQQLSQKLQVAEVERRHATELANRMQDEVKYERAEKAKLADNVKTLASRSTQLAEEIRENRPLAPNTIFNQFVTNRVQVKLTAVRTGFLGSNRRKDADTVLVSTGTNIYAICHIQDTPFILSNPGSQWDELSGSLARNAANYPVSAVSFAMQDPRLVYIPISQAEANALGAKVYRVAADPFKFQDAVLVGAREGYYGECRFQIDLSTPEYLKLDNSFLRGLFGKFNPSSGDLVFSKTGELLGIMANNTYCIALRKFEPAATFHFGKDARTQHTAVILAQLSTMVTGLPLKLQ